MVKKSRTVKRLCAVLLVVATTICLSLWSGYDNINLVVSAESKKYNVDSVEFIVDYENDGDVCITERWNVSYIKGDFSRFYKDIYNPSRILGSFDDIEFIECSINGNDATRAFSSERIDNNYYIEESSDGRTHTINWFLSASDETVCYEVSYILKNAVKTDNSGDAYFSYTFVGEDFAKNIGEVNVEFNISPKDIVWYYDDCKNEYENRFTGVSAPLRCDIKMNPGIFSGLQYYDTEFEWDSNFKHKNQVVVRDNEDGHKSFRLRINFVDLFFLVPLFAVIVSGFRFLSKKVKKSKMKSCQNELQESADRISASGIPFVWCMLISDMKKKIMTVFYVEIFELCRQGRIVIDDDRLIIKSDMYIKDSVQKKIDDDFIEIIKKFFGYSRIEDDDVIMFASMGEVFSDITARRSVYRVLEKWLSDYRNALKNIQSYQNLIESEQLRQIESDLKLWKKFDGQDLLSVDECVKILQRTSNISYYMILSFMIGYKSKSISHADNDGDMMVFCNLGYEIRQNSFDGCENEYSCSSCGGCGGGCSGCGGGGAD